MYYRMPYNDISQCYYLTSSSRSHVQGNPILKSDIIVRDSEFGLLLHCSSVSGVFR